VGGNTVLFWPIVIRKKYCSGTTISRVAEHASRTRRLSAERCGPIGRTLALPRRQGPGVQGMRMAREGKSCYPRSEGYRQASTDSVYQTSADMQNLTLFFTRKKIVGVSRATQLNREPCLQGNAAKPRTINKV